MLCIAFEQEAKNAWKVKDYATIEDALRKALGEACTALRLDPRNADARLGSPVSRTSWSVSPPEEGNGRKETGTQRKGKETGKHLVLRPNSPISPSR